MVTTATENKTDSQIQQDVLRELRWDARVKETEIGVEVDQGIVTLTGRVESYAKKLAAREAAHRVFGVLDVVDDVEVRIPGSLTRTDEDLARAVRHALEWDVFLPDTKIRTTVSHGLVTLEGEVENLVDRYDAERAVRRLQGIKGVANNLAVTVKKADEGKLRKAIQDTLERRADREADMIDVNVSDGKVTLEGRVHSWAEKQAILDAVRQAPNVRFVSADLKIEPVF
ncbi:MAG TPA: BON domain-containing protein [Thermoanaerobaculia bacterium]|jgi:osmotically-inducible protein OsmY|nr:BON domain-containing protein [Thermoanaerobaculia bacterium]